MPSLYTHICTYTYSTTCSSSFLDFLRRKTRIYIHTIPYSTRTKWEYFLFGCDEEFQRWQIRFCFWHSLRGVCKNFLFLRVCPLPPPSSLPIASAKRELLSWAMTMWWNWENEKSKSNSVLLCFSLLYIFEKNLNLLNPPYVSLTHPHDVYRDLLFLPKYGFDKEISQHDFPSAKYLQWGKIMEKLKHFLCATNNIRLQLILCWNWKEMKYPFIHFSRTLVVVLGWQLSASQLICHIPLSDIDVTKTVVAAGT